MERKSFERVSLERGSFERGASLVEAVLAFAFVGAFILGGLYLFGQASHNTRMNEMGTHLAYAIEEVRGANSTGWFKGTSGSRWSRYIPAGGETPYGRIRVTISGSDPADAFRLRYENIPASAIEEMCEPLRQRLIKNPLIDESACASSSGVSDLEIRVRRAERAVLLGLLYRNEIPDCGDPCNPKHWRERNAPSVEEMKVMREVLTAVSYINSFASSCQTSTYECLNIERINGRHHIRTPGGLYEIVSSLQAGSPSPQSLIDDPDLSFTADDFPGYEAGKSYSIGVYLGVSRNVHEHLAPYNDVQNGRGYKGMLKTTCDFRGCWVGAYFRPAGGLLGGGRYDRTWWLNKDNEDD